MKLAHRRLDTKGTHGTTVALDPYIIGPGLSYLSTATREKFYPATIVHVSNDTSRCKNKGNEIPLIVETNVGTVATSMLVHLKICDLVLIDSSQEIPVKLVTDFKKNFNLFTKGDLKKILVISQNELSAAVEELVPCIICRSGSSDLFGNLVGRHCGPFGPFTLDKQQDSYVIGNGFLNAGSLQRLFSAPSPLLFGIQNSMGKIATGRRCASHSLETQRVHTIKPLLEAWNDIGIEGQDALTKINPAQLMETIRINLRLSSRCECYRNNVELAFKLLTKQVDFQDLDLEERLEHSETAFVGLSYDINNEEIVLEQSHEFIHRLLSHAGLAYMRYTGIRNLSTLVEAQEEVVVCCGILLLERLHSLQISFREEVRNFHIIVGVMALIVKKKYQSAIEQKLGKSELELFLDEMSSDERSKEKKKVAKKEKRKRQRNQRKQCEINTEQSTCSKVGTVEEDKDKIKEIPVDEDKCKLEVDTLDKKDVELKFTSGKDLTKVEISGCDIAGSEDSSSDRGYHSTAPSPDRGPPESGQVQSIDVNMTRDSSSSPTQTPVPDTIAVQSPSEIFSTRDMYTTLMNEVKYGELKSISEEEFDSQFYPGYWQDIKDKFKTAESEFGEYRQDTDGLKFSWTDLMKQDGETGRQHSLLKEWINGVQKGEDAHRGVKKGNIPFSGDNNCHIPHAEKQETETRTSDKEKTFRRTAEAGKVSRRYKGRNRKVV